MRTPSARWIDNYFSVVLVKSPLFLLRSLVGARVRQWMFSADTDAIRSPNALVFWGPASLDLMLSFRRRVPFWDARGK